MAKDPLDITWLLHLAGAVALLVGVGMAVYNGLGFDAAVDSRLPVWDESRRLGAAVGAVLIVAGLLLRRVK